jgi:hypothetical protein
MEFQALYAQSETPHLFPYAVAAQALHQLLNHAVVGTAKEYKTGISYLFSK